MTIMLFFFFSSRRRHPRSTRDWSSDVCSSDLDDPRGAALSASVLPLVLAGVLTAALIGVARRPGLGQAGALLVAAPLAVLAAWAGLGLAAVWAGVLRRRPAA